APPRAGAPPPAYRGGGVLGAPAGRGAPRAPTAGRRAPPRLESAILEAARQTEQCGLDDVGTACFRSDLAAMHHETQGTRLFRT
ncbi:MAG: hypothetical protein ABF757_01100, partial [Acetobacter papayae]